MTTLRTSKKSSAAERRLRKGEIDYISRRNQHNAHDLVLKCIKSSGFTQKDISEGTGIDEGSLSRIVSSPRNVELNTLSKLVFFLSGAAISFALDRPGRMSPVVLLSCHPKIYTTPSGMTRFVNSTLTPASSEYISIRTEDAVEIIDA